MFICVYMCMCTYICIYKTYPCTYIYIFICISNLTWQQWYEEKWVTFITHIYDNKSWDTEFAWVAQVVDLDIEPDHRDSRICSFDYNASMSF